MGVKNSEKRTIFITALQKLGKETVTKQDIEETCTALKMKTPQWFTKDARNRVSRGLYRVPTATVNLQAAVIPLDVKSSKKSPATISADIAMQNLIPDKYPNFVPFGNFDDLKLIIESKKFYPVFITGHSGNGKTFSVAQACAQLKRKLIIVSFTPETDESDLFGNYILVNNEMVWKDGPVTVAARQGAVLLIDEIDYGGANCSSLQRVLEGNPFLLKKKNEMVIPAEGFTVFATANTKGKGSEDGRYMFTNVLNEAFLERFPITFEQEWAPKTIEKKIIVKELTSQGMPDAEYADRLIDWANIIRKTFAEGGCQEVISTRRLVHVTRAYAIFKDRVKAIQYCLNRFDKETQHSFLDLYTKLDVTVAGAANTTTTPESTVSPEATTLQTSVSGTPGTQWAAVNVPHDQTRWTS